MGTDVRVREECRARDRWRVCVGVGMCAWTIALGACQQTRSAPAGSRGGEPGEQGQQIMANYALGTLSATLGPEVSVPTLRAAAENTLRARGYVVTDSMGTDDHMRVKGASRSGSEGWLEPTVISARVTYANTRIEIERGTFGDEAASRAILDDLLRRIGR